jgi:hypothetical protein
MAESSGALSDAKTAGFAEIVLPRIAAIAANLLVDRLAVSERLRVNESRGLFQRKSNLRIGVDVGMAALFAKAAVGDDVAAGPIGEIGRTLGGPLGNA